MSAVDFDQACSLPVCFTETWVSFSVGNTLPCRDLHSFSSLPHPPPPSASEPFSDLPVASVLKPLSASPLPSLYLRAIPCLIPSALKPRPMLLWWHHSLSSLSLGTYNLFPLECTRCLVCLTTLIFPWNLSSRFYLLQDVFSYWGRCSFSMLPPWLWYSIMLVFFSMTLSPRKLLEAEGLLIPLASLTVPEDIKYSKKDCWMVLMSRTIIFLTSRCCILWIRTSLTDNGPQWGFKVLIEVVLDLQILSKTVSATVVSCF